MSGAEHEDDAIDRIIAAIDSLLLASDYAGLDEFLAGFDPEKERVIGCMAALSATQLAGKRGLLRNYGPFVSRIREYVYRECPKRARSLLAGLVP